MRAGPHPAQGTKRIQARDRYGVGTVLPSGCWIVLPLVSSPNFDEAPPVRPQPVAAIPDASSRRRALGGHRPRQEPPGVQPARPGWTGEKRGVRNPCQPSIPDVLSADRHHDCLCGPFAIGCKVQIRSTSRVHESTKRAHQPHSASASGPHRCRMRASDARHRAAPPRGAPRRSQRRLRARS